MTKSETSWSAENPQFTLYSHKQGPNGWKVASVLNELGLTYETVFLNFDSREMKHPYFESLNPNGRIPALVDHSVSGIDYETGNGLGIPSTPLPGKELTRSEKKGGLVVWESGAIIQYVCRKYDVEGKIWPKTIEEQGQVESWLHFQVSGQGPYFGQAMWFTNFHPEKLDSCQDRYRAESRRVLKILSDRLSRPGSNGWLATNKFTAADMSFAFWNSVVHRFGIDLEKEFPLVNEWNQRIRSRSSFEYGVVQVEKEMEKKREKECV